MARRVLPRGQWDLARRAWMGAVGLVWTLAIGCATDPFMSDVCDLEGGYRVTDLTGSGVRPNPVITDASGRATITLYHYQLGLGSCYCGVKYEVRLRNITAATAAHVHGPGDEYGEADVIAVLFDEPGGRSVRDGVLVRGDLRWPDAPPAMVAERGISPDSLALLIARGQTYADVHTQANPDGELRGHLPGGGGCRPVLP